MSDDSENFDGHPPEAAETIDADKLVISHSMELDALKTRLFRLEMTVARIMAHLDPHDTSASFHDNDGKAL